MSLQLILDGYNIIHSTEYEAVIAARKLPSVQQRRSDERSEKLSCQMPELIQAELSDQRKLLIEWIDQKRPQGSLKNSVTVVFDGHKSVWSKRDEVPIKVLFSQDQTADDVIKQLVEDAQQPKSIIVITDDRTLQYAVRALGAKVKSVKEFLQGGKSPIAKKEPRGSGADTQQSKYVPKTLEYEITSEMKKIWLENKDEKES